jgi:protein-L-isoaspartate(D-aspartate) O-methyltransferase
MSNATPRKLLAELQRFSISDPRVLLAMEDVARDKFVEPQDARLLAYEDTALPIGCGQTISQPFIVAYMTERLRIMPYHDVLEIGTGSGYQTAILSKLARQVFTIERHHDLSQEAQRRFRSLGLRNITAIEGDGSFGWPKDRLFDRIIVTACARRTPQCLLHQLAPCGMMLIPLGKGLDQRLTLIARTDRRDEVQELLPVRFVPLVMEN